MIDLDRLTVAVVKAKEKDGDAFTYIFEETHNYTYAIACSLLDDPEEAKDVVQETFLKVFLSLSSLQDDRSFLRWLHTITFNICQDHLRVHAREHDTASSMISDQSSVVPLDEFMQLSWNQELIRDMIRALPNEQRDAVYLYYYKNRTIGEIAVIQDVSIGTVKSRLYYARNTLQRLIEAEEKRTGKLHVAPAVTVFSAILMLPNVDITLSQPDAAKILAAVLTATEAAGGISFASAEPKQNISLRTRIASLFQRNLYLRMRPIAVVSAVVLLLAAALGLVTFGYRRAQNGISPVSTEPGSARACQTAAPQALPHSATRPMTAAVICEGKFSETVRYTLTEDGTLTVSGTGVIGGGQKWDVVEARKKRDFSLIAHTEPLAVYKDSIRALVIEEGITEIGTYAFMHLPITFLSLPDSLICIWEAAFAYCTSLPKLEIPDNTVMLSDWAFYCNEALRELTVGKNLEYIGNETFANASELVSIDFRTEVPLSIGSSTFRHAGKLTEINFPKTTILIDEYAFANTGLRSVDLSYTHAAFGFEPFYSSENLETVFLPKDIKTLSSHILSNIPKLSNVDFGTSLQNIENAVFANTALTNIHIPASVSYIAPKAFVNAKTLNTIHVAEENLSYASQDGVLYNKSMTTLEQYPYGRKESVFTVPASVNSIAISALNSKHLRTIFFSGEITALSSYAVALNCGEVDLYFSGDVPRIWEENAIPYEKQCTIHFREGTKGWTEGSWTSPDGKVFKTVMEK